eukprot:scaffold125150_cov64-Phaeocystis_antarctica.AAC.1
MHTGPRCVVKCTVVPYPFANFALVSTPHAQDATTCSPTLLRRCRVLQLLVLASSWRNLGMLVRVGLVRADLARLGCRPSWRCLSSVPRIGELRTLRQVVDVHAQHRKQYRPIDLGSSWNTLGKLVRQHNEKRVLRDIPQMLQPLAEHTEQALPKFNARPLANTVNGLASLHASAGWRAGDALWAGLATHGTRCVPKMKAQELSNTVHGFAKMGRREPALLDAIAKEAAQRGLREFKPQALANTAWAYATAGHAAPALLDAIAKEAAPRLRDFNPQNLSNTAWAYATAGHAAPALLDAIAREAAPRLRDFTPQALSNTAWAFTTAGHAAPALLDAIATEASLRGLRDFNEQDLANTAWAYATAGHAAPALLDAIAREASQRGLRDFTPQALAITAWAYAVADCPAPALFGGDAFVQRCAAERGFVSEALAQLHQWQLWQEERGAAWPPLPPELAERCRAAFCQEEGAPSRLQRDVAASLSALGLAPREEVRTSQGYSLDAVVSHGGREVAVEVDGPWHFLGRTPTGTTALKRRQLRAAGWALLPVPYWEWNALDSKAAKQEYLRAALEGLGGTDRAAGDSA